MQAIRIGELSKQAKVAISAIRYYERVGLLKPLGRTEGRFRHYGAGDVLRLKLIRSFQDLGFRLEEIRSLANGRGRDRREKALARAVGKKLAELEKDLGRLRLTRRSLERVRACCRRGGVPCRCQLHRYLDF